MYGPDIFVVLTAYDQKNKASSAFKLEHNSMWFCKAAGGVAVEPTITSRETTPADFDPADVDNDDEADTVDRLVVPFDKLLALDNIHNGLQLGTNPTSSHILLGHRGTRGISGKQCNIAVDEALHIWVHDYGSTHGTAVGQNGQNETEVRIKETWHLAYEPGMVDEFEERTIHCGSLTVKIEFPNHATAPARYVENLQAFVKKCQEAAEKKKVEPPGVEALGLDSEPVTQAPSEAPTPRERLIYYKVQTIGHGTYGRVHKVIKARDGKAFAAKTFHPPPNKNKRRRDGHDTEWLIKIRTEFALMRDNPHPNVIQVFELRETPTPTIFMAYFPLGNIVDANLVNDDRCVSVFGQTLDGLSHLHAKKVAHRDLKPENLLIKMDPLLTLVIADFGMAKVATDTALLQTFCGSLKYAAPEVFPCFDSSYNPSVDIWSLGVIVLEWMYGIPNNPDVPEPEKKNGKVSSRQWENWIDIWAVRLLNKVDDQESDLVIKILLHMIEIDGQKRWPATRCLTRGFKSGLFKRRVADGLITYSNDPDDLDLPAEEEDDKTKAPTAAPPCSSGPSSLSIASASGESEATIIQGDMWGREELANLN